MTATRRTGSEERILAAAELFYAGGLRGVAMDQVIAEAGVAKSTMYQHFRTKDDLIAAYLRRTDDSWLGQLQAAAGRAGDRPGDQLAGLFDALADAFERHGFFGCPFVSAAVEADLDSRARRSPSRTPGGGTAGCAAWPPRRARPTRTPWPPISGC